MAILNGLIRKMSGSAGDFTFKQLNGQTVVSEKVTTVKNSRTQAQQKHRMKWANLVQMYKGIKPLLNCAFESKEQGVSDYNMFMKVNINVSPVYLSKQDVTAGACIAAPYQLTQGSLPSIVTSGTGAQRKTDINLGSLTLSATTTIAELSNAIVQNNPDYDYGDQISFYLVKQVVNSVTGIPYCQFTASAVALDKTSSAKVWDCVLKAGFRDSDGDGGGKVLSANVTEYGDYVYAWVHSRKESGKTLVSTQFLLDHNAKLSSYNGDDAYTNARKSYGTVKDVFLTPDGVSSGSGSVSTGGSGTGGSDQQSGGQQSGSQQSGGGTQGGGTEGTDTGDGDDEPPMLQG